VERHQIGIIIPAYNEAATIRSIVQSASQFGVPIVVDDGSSDGTGDLAKATGACLVRHAANCGYDQTLNSGFAFADESGFKYVVTIDADGQHDPLILDKFIQALDSGADVVVGVRDCLQRFAEHVFSWVGYIKWRMRDPLCGMKAYRIGVFRELGHFDSYNSIGTELAIYAANSGKQIVQLAVKTSSRADASRFGRKFLANQKIFRSLWIGIFKKVEQGP
jgi:glycosyltransferase involved in cell wall biosynthesis